MGSESEEVYENKVAFEYEKFAKYLPIVFSSNWFEPAIFDEFP